MSTPEIPAEVLQKIFRAFCERRFDYLPENYGSERVRQERIDQDAAVYYAHPDGHLLRLVVDAFQAGRESAYTRDEVQWGMRRSDNRGVIKAFSESDARESSKDNPNALTAVRRRVGPWEEVADADA